MAYVEPEGRAFKRPVPSLVEAALAVADLYREAQETDGPLGSAILSLSKERHEDLCAAVDEYRASRAESPIA